MSTSQKDSTHRRSFSTRVINLCSRMVSIPLMKIKSSEMMVIVYFYQGNVSQAYLSKELGILNRHLCPQQLRPDENLHAPFKDLMLCLTQFNNFHLPAFYPVSPKPKINISTSTHVRILLI